MLLITRPKRAVSVATDLHSSMTQDSSESSTAAVAASDLPQNATRHADQPWHPAGTGTSKRKRESEYFFFLKDKGAVLLSDVNEF